MALRLISYASGGFIAEADQPVSTMPASWKKIQDVAATGSVANTLVIARKAR
jgi:hypothetical protein